MGASTRHLAISTSPSTIITPRIGQDRSRYAVLPLADRPCGSVIASRK